MSEHPGRRFVSPDEVEALVFDWGVLKWISSPRATGAERFSAGVVLLRPGRGHRTHDHPGVEEILYVISGHGEQMVGAERRMIGPGDVVHIPPDVPHETVNRGFEELKILAIYAPPGPEEELRSRPECTLVPPGQTVPG